MKKLTTDERRWRVNHFAIRCFRDTADGDYIAARLACRAALLPQYLWASQQAIEKYLKCILLLHRIKAKDLKHDLAKALDRIAKAPNLELDLCEPTRKFIEYLDTYGRFRYLELSHWGRGRDMLTLDRAVWELRQHCTLNGPPPQKVIEGIMPPRVLLEGGYLEAVIDPKGGNTRTAREALLWENGFFGPKLRKLASPPGWVKVVNAPLTISPEILDEVSEYVFVPSDLKAAYRELARERSSKQNGGEN